MKEKTKSKKINYKIGDIFLIPFSNNTFGVGKILLNIYKLKFTGIFGLTEFNYNTGIDLPSINGMYGSGLLVGYFKKIFTTIPTSLEELKNESTSITEYADQYCILKELCPIIGNHPVKVEELDFPEMISRFGATGFYFDKGGLKINIISSTKDENHEIENFDQYFTKELKNWNPSLVLNIIRSAEDYLIEKKPIIDLRYAPYRKEILEMIHLNTTMNYDEIAIKMGTATRLDILKAAYELEEKNLSLKKLKERFT